MANKCHQCAALIRDVERMTLLLNTYRLPWYKWLWYEARAVFAK